MIGRFPLKPLLLSGLVLLSCTGTRAAAEPFGLGFPPFDQNRSILDSNELLPTVVRKAITAPLSSGAGTASGSFSSISDSFSVSSDYGNWSYRIRSGAKFSNGETVKPGDIVYSLKRCAAKGKLPGFLTAIEHIEAASTVPWVQVNVTPAGPDGAKSFAAAVAGCPVLEAETSLAFEEGLGVGSNVMAAGPYAILTFIPGRKYILDRMRQSARDRSGMDQLELRSFASADQGLAALRVGTIGALAADDTAVVERARNDETLTFEDCSGYWMIRRRGVVVPCVENLSVLEIRENG